LANSAACLSVKSVRAVLPAERNSEGWNNALTIQHILNTLTFSTTFYQQLHTLQWRLLLPPMQTMAHFTMSFPWISKAFNIPAAVTIAAYHAASSLERTGYCRRLITLSPIQNIRALDIFQD